MDRKKETLEIELEYNLTRRRFEFGGDLNMRVLNIEDNLDKHMNICMQLKQLNIKDVIWKDNLTDGVEALQNTVYII